MKQHIIIVEVYDHSIIPRVFEKVCRSKSGAIREARDLNCMALIRRYADKYDAELDKFVFVPKSHFERDGMGNLMVFGTNSYCHVAIEVIDMDGNSVNVCSYDGGCQDYDNEHLCETPDECNCEKVWAELKARGFEGKFPEVEAITEQAEEPVEQEASEEAEDTTKEDSTMTTIKIIDTCKRFTAEDATWQSAHAASIEAERYHDQTGEPVQYANHDGVVLGYIDADGRRFGSYATCG